MPDQLGANFTVAFKTEVTYNTAPGTGSATQLRLVDSPGQDTVMAEIKSAERRGDLLDTLARMGSRESPGSFNTEMSVGSHDTILEAAMRGTWSAALSVTSTGAGAFIDVTANATNQITRTGSGSFITDGFVVGDLVRITNYSTAANNNINLRIKTLTATVMTFHGTPLTIGAADTSATVTRVKKLVNPATPVRRTFYMEQRYTDIDSSIIYGGTRWGGFHITGAPDGMALMELPVLGGVPAQILTGASSPYYVSPTVPTGRALTFADCVLSFDGSDIAKATAFDLNYQVALSAGKFIGASTAGSPDVYDSKATLSGSVTVARSDLAYVTKYLAENALELHVLLTEPESEPKDGLVFHVPNFLLNRVTAPLGGDTFMPEQRGWTAGVKEGAAATGYDTTLLSVWSTAP